MRQCNTIEFRNEIISKNILVSSHLRTTVLNFACSVGLPECLEQAGTKFNEWLNSPTYNTVRPEPDLRNIIYYYGMASAGSREKWDKVWEIYKNETDASEKAKLIYGLSAIRDHNILSR